MDDTLGSDRLNTRLLSRLLVKRYSDAQPADILSIEVKPAVPKGENATSSVKRVKIKCLLKSGKEKTFSLIVKTELPSATDVWKEFPMFSTEIKVFRNILPLMEDLQEEFSDHREPLWADFYGFTPYSMVAFDDLSVLGYETADRRTGLDLSHSLLVLRSMARFHAMSKVLLNRGLIADHNRDSFKVLLIGDSPIKARQTVYTVLSENMLDNWGSEWKELAHKIGNLKEGMADKLAELCDNYDKRFEVFNHGDIWSANLMFRYMEYEKIPISVRYVDFQMCHCNSFIWDVVHFIEMNVRVAVRREQKNDLLRAYHDSLKKNLALFHYNDYMPTFEDVKREHERVAAVRLYFCVASCFLTVESKKPFDAEKMMTHPPREVIDEEVFAKTNALPKIGDELKYFAEIGLI